MLWWTDVIGWIIKKEKADVETISLNDGKELAETETAIENSCPKCKTNIPISSEIGTQTTNWRNTRNTQVLNIKFYKIYKKHKQF